MDVIENRPVLRRIDIGQRIEVDKRRDITEALSGISPVERDRIWRLVEQTARGASLPSEADPEPRSVIVDEAVHHVHLREAYDALYPAGMPECVAVGAEPLFLTRAQAIRLMGDDQ